MNIKYFAACAAFFLFFDSAYATDYVIGLPKGASSTTMRASLDDRIEHLILYGMKTGDTLRIFDAHDIRSIASLDIPEKKAFQYRKFRQKRFRRQMKNIREHIDGLSINGERDSIFLPQFLEHLSGNVFDQRPGNAPVHVLVFGNAFYVDEREEAFSMRKGWFPSDGHLKVSQLHSVYGTVKKRGRLKNFSVHMLYTNKPETWPNDLYRHRIHRFWHLFVKTQGGALLTFAHDVEAAFDRFAKAGLRSNERFDFDHTAGKVEMLRAWREAVPVVTDPLSVPAKVTPEPIPEHDGVSDFMENGVEVSTEPPLSTRGKIKVGIRWPCNRCDIDLHARASDSKPFLNYGRVETEEGKYFKDFRSSPDTINGLEHIEFTEDIDVNDLQVFVNFYSGKAEGGPKGVVRVLFEERIYEGSFHIQSSEGNVGKQRDNADSSPYWEVIDIPSILGLTDNVGRQPIQSDPGIVSTVIE